MEIHDTIIRYHALFVGFYDIDTDEDEDNDELKVQTVWCNFFQDQRLLHCSACAHSSAAPPRPPRPRPRPAAPHRRARPRPAVSGRVRRVSPVVFVASAVFVVNLLCPHLLRLPVCCAWLRLVKIAVPAARQPVVPASLLCPLFSRLRPLCCPAGSVPSALVEGRPESEVCSAVRIASVDH
jgi:hypothetical protein